MDLRQSITDQTDVSLSLAGHVSSTEAKSSNLVFSPLSIHVLLSLIAAGSGAPTRDQLLSFLKSKSTDDLNKLSSELVTCLFADGSPSGGPKLRFANGLWVKQTLPLKPTFKQAVDHFYKAASNQVDFQNKAVEVTSEVNSWAEKQTSGLIKEVLPPGLVDNSTMLVFANALYFKGAWSEKFDVSNTKEDDFYLHSGSSVKVPFMTDRKKHFIRAFDGFKVLRLPYKQGEDTRSFSMYIFLPDAKDGLPALVEKVSSQASFLNQHLLGRKVKMGNFRHPRFKISFGFEALDVLKGLGVELPFSRGGLTEMADSHLSQNLYVSSIYQKSFIEVNEEGTEAAAVSVAQIALMCFVEEVQEDFVADYPFIFMIREDVTGVVLFIGHVINPLES